jgi:hypothetical protein
VKVHVHVHGRAARELRGQVDIFDLLAAVVEVIAVDVEKRVERRVEALPRKNLWGGDAVLAVDFDFDVLPAVGRAVVDRQPAAVKLKWIDGRRFRAPRKAQAETRKRDGCGGQAPATHGL